MVIPKLDCSTTNYTAGAGQFGQLRLNEIYGPTTYLLPTGRVVGKFVYPIGIGSIVQYSFTTLVELSC